MIKVALVCLVLTLCSWESHADPLTIAWSTPATKKDGSPIEGDLTYRLLWTYNNVVQPEFLDIEANSYTIPDVQAGIHTFQVSAGEDGLYGDYSDPYTRVLGDKEISSPEKVTLSVTLDCTNCDLEVK